MFYHIILVVLLHTFTTFCLVFGGSRYGIPKLATYLAKISLK